MAIKPIAAESNIASAALKKLRPASASITRPKQIDPVDTNPDRSTSSSRYNTNLINNQNRKLIDADNQKEQTSDNKSHKEKDSNKDNGMIQLRARKLPNACDFGMLFIPL